MTAVIWRKSTYESQKCPECGRQVMDEDNRPIHVREALKGQKIWMLCEKCGTPVAYIEPYQGKGKPGERMGKWPGN